MRILGVDHGLARAGVAICDPTGTLVRPLTVVEPPAPAEIARLVAENDAGMVVIGLPLGLDGTPGEQARHVLAFKEELENLVSVPVDTYDERLTTRMAESSRRAGASAHPDALAAAHLLEAFIAFRDRNAARAEFDPYAEDWPGDPDHAR